LPRTATNKKKYNNQKIVKIARVGVCPEHIRKSTSNIDGLKSTIADVGLLQPILVRRSGDNFVVIDGARRLEALKALDVTELIVGRDMIIDADETEADTRFKEIIANIQREGINDIELGYAFLTLNETYGYQYKEVAAILGVTQHYVAAKVGLAKRLTPEMQALVVKDLAAAQCISNTSQEQTTPVYSMYVNVIEDIARLPAELQKPAYEAIKANEMDTKEALGYLKSIKQDAEVLQIADDVQGLMQSYTDNGNENAGKDAGKYIKKLDKDFERLFNTIKSGGNIDREQLVPALESLIERLNQLYSEISIDKADEKAPAIAK
jgi:ParB family transcriptional regulator, chromosome partitioning protein